MSYSGIVIKYVAYVSYYLLGIASGQSIAIAMFHVSIYYLDRKSVV